MNAPTKPASNGAAEARKARLGKVHIAKKQLSLDDATYRQILARLFKGRTSAADLTVSQLDELLDHFVAQGFRGSGRPPRRAGNRAMAHGPAQDKLRALWLSLYHLGSVRDPSEAALAKYVQRTTGVTALQWLKGERAMQAIEGLKSMAGRAGVDWSTAGLGAWADYLPAHAVEPFAVVSAQWRLLLRLGARRGPATGWWAPAITQIEKSGPHEYTPADWHGLMERFGRAVRQAQAS